MASSSEAFEKFSMWKKSCTLLRVTMGEANHPQRLVGTVLAAEEPLILFSLVEPREPLRLDLDGASFSVEERRVEVTRGDEDSLVFEEYPVF